MEEGLCTAARPEVEVAEIQLGTGSRDAGCRAAGWRRTRDEGTAEEAARTSGKGAARRGGCRLRAGCGAACRWVWTDACSPDSG